MMGGRRLSDHIDECSRRYRKLLKAMEERERINAQRHAQNMASISEAQGDAAEAKAATANIYGLLWKVALGVIVLLVAGIGDLVHSILHL